MVLSARMPLSEAMASNAGGTYSGTISAVSRPSCVPAAANRCDRSAYWSCSSRGMALIFAIFSADSPMDSPVLGSAMAGVIGTRSRGRTFASARTRPPNVFAFDAATSASLMPREWRIGTFDSDSAPPAMMTSAWPSAIWSAASVMAWFADAQARPTVNDCTPFGSSGRSETSRAMFGASTDCTTVP